MSVEEGGAHCARNSDPCTTVPPLGNAPVAEDPIVFAAVGFAAHSPAPAAAPVGLNGRQALNRPEGGSEVSEEVVRVAQFVEFTRFVPQDKKGEQPPSRVTVNVAHITAVVPHPDGGTGLPP